MATNSIDFSDWKEFAFRDIFEIRKGFYNKKPEQLEEGDIPFLGATDSNNGVTAWYTIDEIESSTKTGAEPNSPLASKLFPGNAVCVTNNGSVGHAYYQPKQFTCSHDVNPLYRKGGEFNVYTGLFVATVIMHDKYRWQYGRKWRPARMVNSKIHLPATSDGNPDWQYMEDFIKSLNHKPLTTSNKADSAPALNLSTWQGFKIEDLFERFERGKANQTKLEDGDDVFYVGAKRDDNGVMLRGAYDEALISGGNCIVFISNGQGSVGFANYMDRDFIASTDLVLGYAEWLNANIGMFLATVFSLERPKYSFGRKWGRFLKGTTVKLPVKSDESGKPIIDPSSPFSPEGYIPDWQFMEDYIRSLPYGDRIPQVGEF